ncbi:hypothetical protein AUP68_05304 [Ilyonectria robusta]
MIELVQHHDSFAVATVSRIFGLGDGEDVGVFILCWEGAHLWPINKKSRLAQDSELNPISHPWKLMEEDFGTLKETVLLSSANVIAVISN